MLHKDSKEGHDGVFLFEPHTRPINVISLDPCDDAKVFTCSYDGTIRCGDLHNQQFLQVGHFKFLLRKQITCPVT